MPKFHISIAALNESISRMSEANVNPNMLAVIALKGLGVNTSSYVRVESTADLRGAFLDKYFAYSHPTNGKRGYYKPFSGEVAFKGNYAHGTLYSPLREQRKPVGKHALIWERDELELPSNDETNYRLKFKSGYETVVQEEWLGRGKVPLVHLAVYLQSKEGAWTGPPSLNSLLDNWKQRLHLTPAELSSWFVEEELTATLFSEDPELAAPEDHVLSRCKLIADEPASRATEPQAGNQIIVAGPPGCGKSTYVASLVNESTYFRCVFHPATSKADFIGSIKPTLSAEKGVPSFEFIPGPLSDALIAALEDAAAKVYLIVEELNRADAASVFSDTFQLLDRDDSGWSRFPINPTPDLKHHLEKRLGEKAPNLLKLPPNLFIIATINNADESLRPIDSAFRRRWEWMEIDPLNGAEKLKDVEIEGQSVRWLEFIERLNEEILRVRPGEDCRIGAFYLKPIKGQVTKASIKQKLLPYLWQDVHRAGAKPLFNAGIDSLPGAQLTFDESGLSGIFEWF